MHPVIKLLLKFILIIALVFVILVIILYNADPDGTYENNYTPTTGNTVTIVLLDGLSQKIFQEQLAAGNLPHMDELIQKSTYVENGVGSFPTMTGYAFYPFITGRDATESGIFGLRWFDRKLDKGNLRNYVGRTNIRMNEDVDPDILNFFEKYDAYFTASINTYMNRGAHHSIKTGWAHTTAKYNHNTFFPALRAVPFVGKEIAKDHFQHETLVTDLAIKQLANNPKVQWITYPSMDAHNHVHGTDSTYYALMHHLDREIGRLRNAMQDNGQEERMLVIVSDHGVVDVERHLDIPGVLSGYDIQLERGPSTNLWSDELNTPLSDLADKDGYYVINGNLSAYLYLKDQSLEGNIAWRERQYLSDYQDYKGISLTRILDSIPGVELIALADSEQAVHIFRNGKEAVVTRNAVGAYGYGGEDALDFDRILQKDSMYTTEEWLNLTLGMEFPYAPVRLYDLLTAPDAPDLVLTSEAGYDVAVDYEIFVDNYKGGHGGISRDLLVVPYIIHVPGKEARIINAMTSEEVGKLIGEYLGK